MSTITLPNIRVGSDLQVRVRLKDGGVAIDWSTLQNIKACIYSDAQRALAGRCAFSIDEEDNTLLVCTYAANKPQYLGVNRIVISAKYMGETKTYDKPAFTFVRWTADQDGEQITIDDPDVDVEIEVSDVSSSLLDEAIRAAFTAAEEAVDAKGQVLETEAEVEAAEALRVSAEESRVEAEEGRAEAEAARVEEEAVRVSAEDARVVAENARAAAEDLREGAEDDRAAAETARETAEAARVAAEALRVTAEGSRETAEAAREAQASADHTVAAGDHTQAAADHTQAAADHTTAASDHTQAGADHTLAAADHVTAGEDHAQAQDDHEVMEGYDTRLGSVESEVSQLEAKVDEIATIQSGVEKTQSDFTLTSKVYSTTAMETSSNANYDSIPIVDVTPGTVIKWTGFATGTGTDICLSQYDGQGNPVTNHTNNRVTYSDLTDGGMKYTIPSGVYKIGLSWKKTGISSSSEIIIGNASFSFTTKSINDIDEQLGIQDLKNEVESISNTVEGLEDVSEQVLDLENLRDELLVVSQATNIPDTAFSNSGIYSTTEMSISSNASYKSTQIYDCNPGDVFTWSGFPTPGTTDFVAALYSADGTPVTAIGSNNRINYASLSELSFTIPSGVYKIGFVWRTGSYPLTSTAKITTGSESTELTQEAAEMVKRGVGLSKLENAIATNQIIGDTRADYYLKGNSHIPASVKKLGIITGGQSNAEGRCAYSDLPAGFVNPNSKVKFCDNTNGTFSAFEVYNGGSGNDWAFDAITYDALTNPSYGNQSEIYVMKKARGGTSIDKDGSGTSHWTADYEFLSSPSNSLLLILESVVRAGIVNQGENFEIRAICWHQGEGDSKNAEVAARYYDNLKKVIAYIRGVVGNPRLHFFCGTISDNNVTDPYVSVVNAAYERLATEDPYLHLIDLHNAVLKDNYHFNAAWSIYFGQMVYDAMVDAGLVSGTKINPTEPS